MTASGTPEIPRFIGGGGLAERAPEKALAPSGNPKFPCARQRSLGYSIDYAFRGEVALPEQPGCSQPQEISSLPLADSQ